METVAEPMQAATRIIRVPRELADMLGGIVEIEGGTVAELVDPLIRPEVERRFAKVKPTLDKIRRAKEQHRSGK